MKYESLQATPVDQSLNIPKGFISRQQSIDKNIIDILESRYSLSIIDFCWHDTPKKLLHYFLGICRLSFRHIFWTRRTSDEDSDAADEERMHSGKSRRGPTLSQLLAHLWLSLFVYLRQPADRNASDCCQQQKCSRKQLLIGAKRLLRSVTHVRGHGSKRMLHRMMLKRSQVVRKKKRKLSHSKLALTFALVLCYDSVVSATFTSISSLN